MAEVLLSECWARDGIQVEPPIATTDKLAVLDAIGAAGFTRIELTSFVHPKAFPQFGDAADVVRGYRRRPGVEYAVLVPNPRGLDLMLHAQGDEQRVDSVTLILAASESYNVKNTNRTHDAALGEIERLTERAHAAGLIVTACVGTAWGCPIEGRIAPGRIVGLAQRLASFGADRIMLGDTTGEAVPRAAGELVGAVRECTGLPVIGHFHDPRGAGAANAFAAAAAGATWLDVALGGTGGHAPEPGVQRAEAGNVCSEDLAAMLAGSDMLAAPIDLERLVAAGAQAEHLLGRALKSAVQRAGLPVTLHPVAA